MSTLAQTISGAISLQRSSPKQTRVQHFSIDQEQFASAFDRRAFYIQHDLCDHSLFKLDAMAALSQRLHPYFVEWNDGNQQRYGNTALMTSSRATSSETITTIEERPGWVLLRRIERDPIYKSLIDELLDEIRPYSERTRPGMQQRQAFLFISSRAAVTPFHFDPEHNFLLQLRGSKTVHMWDPQNRDVLSEAALDNFYGAVATNRDQPYRDDFLQSAWILPLKAGQGVHFPLHAPHWVKTESDVSISMAITFRSHHSKFQEAVRVGNGHVRRFGLTPPAPNTSLLWDTAAHGIYLGDRAVRRAGKLINRVHRLISPNAPNKEFEYQ